MKKFGRVLTMVLLALCLACCGALVACGDKDDGKGTAKVTDGRWSWASEKYSVSLKLKEDKTFYMSVFMEGNETAGTWELKNEQKKFYKIVEGSAPSENDTDKTEYTASQTLVLTAYNGTVYTAAYADDTLWNCTFPGMGSRTLTHDKDYAWKESDEKDVKILSVCTAKDSNKKLVLYHTKNFDDQTGAYTEGTWEQSATGYTLKKQDGSAYATVTKLVNGECTYTPASGDAVTLYAEAWTPTYNLTAEKDVTLKDKSEAETVNFSLKLWQDKTADVYMTDADFKTSILASGTWEDGENGKVKVTLGEAAAVETNAPDNEGNFTIALTLAAGDTFAAETAVTLKGQAGAFVYAAVATPNSFAITGVGTVSLSNVQMMALRDGTYSVTGTASMGGNSIPVTLASGTYSEEFVFAYTDKDNAAQTAIPKVDENYKIIVEFNNVKLEGGASFPFTCIAEKVTVTLGNSWNVLGVSDYVTEDVTEKYSAMDGVNAAIKGAYLFMKDGKFEVSINYGPYVSVIKGTYAKIEGNVVFSVDGSETKFTSADGKVTMNGTVTIGVAQALSFTFTIANKATVIAASNGETPFQTDTTIMIVMTSMELVMKPNQTFEITYLANVNSVPNSNPAQLCKGTYTVDNGVYTFNTSYTPNGGELTQKTFTSANGKVSFVFENYNIAGYFNGGTVTGIFNLAA